MSVRTLDRKFAPQRWKVSIDRVAPDCRWSHRGLVVAWPGWHDAYAFGGSFVDANNYSQPDPIHQGYLSRGFAQVGAGSRGQTYQMQAGQTFVGGPTLGVLESTVPDFPTGPCSIVLHYHKLDAVNRNSSACGHTANIPASYFEVIIPNASGRVRWVIGASELFVDALSFGDDVWVFTNGSRGMEIWQNGILRASNGTNATRSPLNSFWGLFGSLSAAGFESDFAESGALLLYNRQLEPMELQALTIDPWMPFRPARRRSARSIIAGGGSGSAAGARRLSISLGLHLSPNAK